MTPRGTPVTGTETAGYRVSTSTNPSRTLHTRAYAVIATVLSIAAFVLTTLSSVAPNPTESTHRTWMGMALAGLGALVFFYGLLRQTGRRRTASLVIVLGTSVGVILSGWLLLRFLGLF